MELKSPVIAYQSDYPFALLDEIVEVQVNLHATAISKPKPTDLKDQFARECHKVWTLFKSQIFCLLSDEQIKVTIDQYLLIIRHLKNQLSQKLKNLPPKSRRSSYQILIELLDGLETSIRERYPNYTTNFTAGQPANKAVQRSPFKLLCHLSADQLGLIIKAADETRLVEARSLSLVYQTIVPFLATKNKQELSWDAMRSSTYHPEEIDKVTAIAALEKMIAKIKQQ